MIPDFVPSNTLTKIAVLTNIALLYYSVTPYLYVNRDTPLEQHKPDRRQIQTPEEFTGYFLVYLSPQSFITLTHTIPPQ